MKIEGLIYVGRVNVPEKTNGQKAANYGTFAVGDGEWSIEARDADGNLLAEFVGLNGTNGEEPTDLWAQVNEWAKQVATPAYSYKEFEAPDGTRGSITFFRSEAERGRLHGCLACF